MGYSGGVCEGKCDCCVQQTSFNQPRVNVNKLSDCFSDTTLNKDWMTFATTFFTTLLNYGMLINENQKRDQKEKWKWNNMEHTNLLHWWDEQQEAGRNTLPEQTLDRQGVWWWLHWVHPTHSSFPRQQGIPCSCWRWIYSWILFWLILSSSMSSRHICASAWSSIKMRKINNKIWIDSEWKI